MLIKEIFNKKSLVFSFEIFPPKTKKGMEKLPNLLERLSNLNPDYISVTYGAGGNILDNKTLDIASMIKNDYNTMTVAHLTAISSSKSDIDNFLKELKIANINNILALRGDIPKYDYEEGYYEKSTDLIRFLKEENQFGVSASCYPEGHIENKSIEEDLKAVKSKMNAGADYLISQLFFNNQNFYNYMNLLRAENINIPIQAGIMPITNKKQIKIISNMCGASIPKELWDIIDEYEYDEEKIREIGLKYAIQQIKDLIEIGVDGIHLYTMNDPDITEKIMMALD